MDASTIARAHLAAWRADYPVDLYGADTHLRLATARYAPREEADVAEQAGRSFGRVVPRELAPLVASYQSRPPRLTKYDGAGNVVETIEFDASYHDAGRLVWGSGLVAAAARPGAAFTQATLFYLAAHEGEMGHLCAATCTTGLIRVLRRAGDPALIDRYLPALADTRYERAARGAQFLTEVQGGSDVGAIATVATFGPDGHRLRGEKWFCSVADADLFLVLARPDGAAPGTSGLACFVVPRTVDGEINGFRVRRLKEKLGTTSMASAEIEFDGACGHLVGSADGGFKLMVTSMLNTSRWLNAIGNVGMMRRAYLEASAYARHREAFGVRIASFSSMRARLAAMKAEWLAALHSTWLLTELDRRLDAAASARPDSDGDAAVHRLLVNGNKVVTAGAATHTMLSGIEVLGGNGAIEDFSVLPRLLRDCIVFEQWEGTGDVLAAQVARDLRRPDLPAALWDRLDRALGAAPDDGGAVVEQLASARNDLAAAWSSAVAADAGASFRPLLEAGMRALQAALLLEAASGVASDPADELIAAAETIVARHLGAPSWDQSSPTAERAERVLGGDV